MPSLKKFIRLLTETDGTGRLAMNYFLVMHNHPPVIIHEEDRMAYYDALEAWDLNQNLDSLRDFLRSQTEKTWEKQMVRIAKKKSSCCSP